ncbi:transcription elongation factor GreA [Candidatus Legionella polyplacis]|uniref:Transcription elongation factor GreA n=1 Tax=Candidatus Legionella polyplacis TaxID=2005262 RepID=A0ABZ2H0S9_9GAMM
MKRYPMTTKGLEELKNQLHYLKTIERPRIIESLIEARAHGDLKENAEYHAACEQQNFNEKKIKDIEIKLMNSQVIDTSKLIDNGKVIFGSTVCLHNITINITMNYQIVGEDEADIKLNKISYISPIGKSLLGKSLGDLVSVKIPDGVVQYKILKIFY